MKRTLLLLALLAPLLTSANLVSNITPPSAAQFEAANKLYEEKKFPEAVAGYESILKSGSASPAVWFNLGNAYFKSGQTGHAILAYHRAEAATPRDPDIRANLKFARNQVQGPTLQKPRWQQWVAHGFSVNEWTACAAVGVWLTFLCLTAARLRPDLKPFWSPCARIAGVLTLFQIVGLTASLIVRSPDLAVVTAHEVVIHNGPLDESASAFTAHDGAELRVIDRKDDWLQVTDGMRRTGWLKRTEVGLIN